MIVLPWISRCCFFVADKIAHCCPCLADDLFESGDDNYDVNGVRIPPDEPTVRPLELQPPQRQDAFCYRNRV